MLDFTNKDKNDINKAYKAILLNLKDYLLQLNLKDDLDYSKITINMLHNGLFSIKGTIKFENYFDYLALSSLISEGVHVMYGICCCRHATDFIYDLLSTFKFNLMVQYIWVNNTTGIWRKVNPVNEKANHKVIMINNNENKYLIDAANKFILQIENDGQLNPINIESIDNIELYQDSNINTVGKILKKYYTYKELGIKTVYEYN